MCACIVLWHEPPFAATGSLVGHQVCRFQIVPSMSAVNSCSSTNIVTQVFVHSLHHHYVGKGGRGRLTASATDTDVMLRCPHIIGHHMSLRPDSRGGHHHLCHRSGRDRGHNL